MELIRHPLLRLGARYEAPPAVVQPLTARARLDAGAAVPADWLRAIPANGDALGNDQDGNCWEVARRWCIALRRAVAAGDATRPTTAECVGDYTALTGFSPVTRQPDSGTSTRVGMTDWCTRGVRINGQVLDIVHWLTVDPANDAHVAQAIGAAGPLMATWRLPVAMQDLSAWSKAPGTGSDWQTIWGEHETCLGATNGRAETRTRTWGQDLDVHPEIRRRYMIALDVPLDLSPGGWLGTGGLTPLGLDVAALRADMARLVA